MKLLLCALGLLGGVFWVSLGFYPPQCAPVTEAAEVFCNRLWSPALVSMGLGYLGLFITTQPGLTRSARLGFMALLVGWAMMFLGNFVEYWLLNQLPHEGPAGIWRGLAWMTVLLGLLVHQVASASVGFLGLKAGFIPKWLSVCLLLLLPATLVAGFVDLQWVGLPLGLVSSVAGFSGLMRSRSQKIQRGT